MAGGHWYWRETGEPCHEIEGANGKLRSPDLRDAKRGLKGKLDPFAIVPSVTGIAGAFGVPGSLANWMVNTALECAAEEPPFCSDDETLDDYLLRIQSASKRKRAEAPALGTEVHARIAGYLTGKKCNVSIEAEVVALPALTWIDKNVVKVLAVEESFATPVYGGTPDLYAELTGDRIGYADWKTQATRERFGHKTRAWDEWGEQLIAYADGHGGRFNTLCNVVLSTTKPGEWGEHTWTQVEQLRRQWECKLRYYQLVNNWWPPARLHNSKG